jgi:hypothetical protein
MTRDEPTPYPWAPTPSTNPVLPMGPNTVDELTRFPTDAR